MTRSLLAGLMLALAGCATFPPLAADQPGAEGEFGEWMTIAEAHAAAGQVDSAVAAFRAAASDAPARKEPWLRIARLRAGNDEPALAMIAAGEVLRRDPGDISASDIYLASGLQIAVDTLQRLRASDADRHARYRPQAQAVVELLTHIYAVGDVLPAPVAQELANQAVEQWKREHPAQAGEPERPASPLDILGGD
jgi:hypothetical protein